MGAGESAGKTQILSEMLSTFLSGNPKLLALGALIICAFALVRLSQIRDSDGERLPPSFAAKSFFLLSHLLIYGLVVIACVFSPDILSQFPGADDFSPAFRAQIPLFSVVFIGFLFSLPQVKEIEKQYAIFLHSAQHRISDEDQLSHHLESCAFTPSDHEQRLNDVYLHQFNLYITNRDSGLIKLNSVEAWRKVNALLRRLREEDRAGRSTLTEKDRREVERLEQSHRRKTGLAVSIIRILNDLGSDGRNPDKLARITELLTSAPHHDRETVGEAEDLAQSIIAMPARERADSGKPLRISEQQMMQYLSQIESYFVVEYKLILSRLSRLASKNVIRAGDLADDRLEDLKHAGFAGLGAIEQVTLDRVIWVLFTSWVVAFGVLSVSFLTVSGASRVNPALLISIASTVALATLIGTVWGSRRSLAEKRVTPWSSYVNAGIIAVAGFCLVNLLRFAFNPETVLAFLRKTDPGANILSYFVQILPFSVNAFLLTVGICRLARVRDWHWGAGMPDRVKDGLVLGLIYLGGWLAGMIAHIMFGTNYGARLLATFAEQWPRTAMFGGVNFLIGFLIGAIIIRDVRMMAHSRVIERNIKGAETGRAAGAAVERDAKLALTPAS
jgi:hypothetical protein